MPAKMIAYFNIGNSFRQPHATVPRSLEERSIRSMVTAREPP
jgi:hypothetical protein